MTVPRRSFDLSLYVATLLLTTLILLTFCGVESFEFLNVDDNEYITENNKVNSGLTWGNVYWALTHAHSGHWHPLTWISLMCDVSMFGLNSGASHLINLLLHCLTIVLLFLLLDAVTGARWRSLFASAFIGVNPLRLESVAWVAERKDVLSMLFCILTIIAYVWFLKKPSIIRFSAVMVAYALGLMSKPSLVPLPLLLLALDFWPLNRLSPLFAHRKQLKILLEKIPLIVLALVTSFLTILAQDASGGLKPLSAYPVGERCVIVFVGYLTYLGKLFWPFNLSAFYPIRPYPSGLAAGAMAALTAISYGTYLKRKESPYLLTGWLWFIISLFPVIGIVQIGAQQVADRWTYLPHIGLSLAVTWFVCEKLKDLISARFLASLGLIIILALAFLTHSQLQYWRDSNALFTRALEVSPDNFFAHTNLGVSFDRRNDLESAARHYEEAIRLNPTYTIAINNLGSLRARQGRLNEAIILFERALRTSPEFVPARYHLGLAHEMRGDHIIAIIEWIYVLKLDPNYDRAINSLAFVLTASERNGCSAVVQQTTDHNSKRLQELQSAAQGWNISAKDQTIKERVLRLLACYR